MDRNPSIEGADLTLLRQANTATADLSGTAGAAYLHCQQRRTTRALGSMRELPTSRATCAEVTLPLDMRHKSRD
jgi:hypothetical protein